jgi:hypothetical protein
MTKKGKDKKKSVPGSPALYHGIYMLKSNVDTSGNITGYNKVCELID